MVNSRHPLFCAPRKYLRTNEACLSRSYGGNLPSSFDTVLSIASVCSTGPPVSVSGTVLMLALFPGTRTKPRQSDKPEQQLASVTSSRPRTINLVPIDYGFRPRLRGRLTLRGLTLRRNPWTCGERVSHPLSTLLMSAFSLPMPPGGLAPALRRPTERSATTRPGTLPRAHPQLRCTA